LRGDICRIEVQRDEMRWLLARMEETPGTRLSMTPSMLVDVISIMTAVIVLMIAFAAAWRHRRGNDMTYHSDSFPHGPTEEGRVEPVKARRPGLLLFCEDDVFCLNLRSCAHGERVSGS
jgi:hypothetical protein